MEMRLADALARLPEGLSGTERLRLALLALEAVAAFDAVPTGDEAAWARREDCTELARQLLERKLPVDEAAASRMAHCLARAELREGNLGFPLSLVIGAMADWGGDLSDTARAQLETVRAFLDGRREPNERKAVRRLAELLGVATLLDPGERWADAALAELGDLGPPWEALLEHARHARKKPTQKWAREARTRLKGLDVAGPLRRWWGLVGNGVVGQQNGEVLRGTVVLASLSPAPLGPDLSQLATRCVKSVRGGRVCSRAATAAIWALARRDEPEHILHLETRLKGAWIQAELSGALQAVAEARQTTIDALRRDLPALDLGFESLGHRVFEIGGCRAEINITGSKVSTAWFAPDGRPRKSVPAAAKKADPHAVKAVSATAKACRGMLSTWATRAERSWLEGQSWSPETFARVWWAHPIVGTLARRLAWSEEGEGLRFRLWHPLDGATPAELEDQPFEQVKRLTYAPLPGERDASERFAGELVRQPQLNAMAEARGWTGRLLGRWEQDEGCIRRPLAAWDLEAELGLLPSEETDYTPSGLAVFVELDALRFLRGGAPLPFAGVPPLVFSEILRDLALMVKVSLA